MRSECDDLSARSCRSAAAPGMACRIAAAGAAVLRRLCWLRRRSGGGAVVRRRTIFLGFGAGGAAAVLPSSSGAASASGAAAAGACAARGWRAACPCLWTRFCDFGSSAAERRRAARRSVLRCCSGAPLYRSFGTPCSRPGTPSGNTGLRSPGSFFLVSRKSSRSDGSQSVCRCRSRPARRTARSGQRRRSDVASGAWSISHSTRFPRQLLATGGSNACSASARERRLAGVSPSLAIMSSHCRVAAASLARQADSASNSRAVWR